MVLVKKRISLLNDYVQFKDEETNSLIEIHFGYWREGWYEISIYLATKPQNKYFKGWKRIGYDLECDEEYETIEKMLEAVGYAHLINYLDQQKQDNESLKKWQEFIKNT